MHGVSPMPIARIQDRLGSNRWQLAASDSWKTRRRRRQAPCLAVGRSLLPKGHSPEPSRQVTPAPDAHPAVAETFSQAGEDRIVNFAITLLRLAPVTYLDIGANDPIVMNNTYYFYRQGHRGVLVEPNVELCKNLREVRPQDTTLAAGIGVTAVKEADYYLLNHHALNTFSKEQAEKLVNETNGHVKIKEVIKVPLLNINDVMQEHFKGARRSCRSIPKAWTWRFSRASISSDSGPKLFVPRRWSSIRPR